jgi:glutamate 5-kinase
MSNPREALKSARRVVVKVGSRLLATKSGLIPDLARQISEASANTRREFLIVSSGAVSLGVQKLGYGERPRQMPRLQAAAAVGQGELMRRYAEAFAQYGKTVAQVLLTHSDLASRRRVTNAQQALGALFEAGAIPIVNENDTVSTAEIAFGDNDQLASMVAPLVQADLLLLLTDVSGVLDPNDQRISVMTSDSVMGERKASNPHGTGGMARKVEAAVKASHSGASVIIGAAGEPEAITRMLAGEDLGTLFPPHNNSLKARKHWIAYTLRPRGDLLINAGAVNALRSGGSSLLPVGVVGVRGRFSPGDAVRVIGPDGDEVARGLAKLGVLEVAHAAGQSNAEISEGSGAADQIVIHRDDLVLFS